MKKILVPIFSLLCFYSSTYTHALKPNTFTNVQTLKNVAYGPHPQQVMDVYFPANVNGILKLPPFTLQMAK